VVTSVASQWPPVCGDQQMHTCILCSNHNPRSQNAKHIIRSTFPVSGN